MRSKEKCHICKKEIEDIIGCPKDIKLYGIIPITKHFCSDDCKYKFDLGEHERPRL